MIQPHLEKNGAEVCLFVFLLSSRTEQDFVCRSATVALDVLWTASLPLFSADSIDELDHFASLFPKLSAFTSSRTFSTYSKTVFFFFQTVAGASFSSAFLPLELRLFLLPYCYTHFINTYLSFPFVRLFFFGLRLTASLLCSAVTHLIAFGFFFSVFFFFRCPPHFCRR